MSGLACSDCREATRLRTELREVREELAEWRRHRAPSCNAANDLVRLVELRRRIPTLQSGAGKLLLDLYDHAGTLRGYQSLLLTVAKDEETETKIVLVYCSHLRKALRGLARPVRVVTVWGQGYMLERPEADALRDFMGWPA